MSLVPGSHLGPYEIVGPIGAGGMGEVYKARDTRLERAVAIKVLPAHLSAQAEIRERFEREARAVSSLKHPNICVLHDIGEQHDVSFLVLELLEGESLAERLSRGPLPLPEAVRYGLEIADALDQAHRQGVVHRDLKPGNIMITASGSKLLDFGLAKFRDPAPGAAFAAVSQIATQENNLTARGTILGTLQYMAPEQLEGKETDARTDIFAFGVVLYEMITGRRAFEGRSQVSLIAAILEHEPAPVRSIQPLAPAALEHVLARCLAKDPDHRWQSARDLTHELRWATQGRQAEGPAIAEVSRPRRPAERAAWPLAAVSLLTAVVVGSVHLFESEPPQPTVRFEVRAPAGTDFPGGTLPRMALSPDGTMLAFSTTPGSGLRSQLWVRRLDAVEATALDGTDGANGPFWSPDGRFIGFFVGGALKTIDIAGGPPETVCDVPRGAGRVPHGTWNRDGVILFGGAETSGIQRVSAAGGEPTPVTEAEVGRAHFWPQFLPDGRHFLFQSGPAPGDREIYVGSLGSKDVKRLFRSEYQAEFALPGYLLFVRDRTLFAQPFDLASLELQGEPVRLAGDLSVYPSIGRAGFTVSNAGVLAFRQGGSDTEGSALEFRSFDRTGKELGRAGGAWAWRGLDLSPDGKRIAGHRHDDPGGDVWIADADGANSSRVTFDPSQHSTSPVWSPDGAHLAFGSFRNGAWGIYRKASNLVGADELLFESKLLILPLDWSADGQTIIFWMLDPKTSGDFWRLPLNGDRKAIPFLQSPASEGHGQLSPDGRWLVYASNDSLRNEIFVQSFPTAGTKYQLTTNGGNFPRWRHDGKEILFMAPGPTRAMGILSVPVQPAGEGLKFGSPQRLFDSGYINFTHAVTGGGIYHTFAVSPDGQRIIVPLQRDNDAEANSPLIVVLNWAAALRR